MFPAMPTMNGLILIGGKSSRMGEDKSLMLYHARAQRDHLYALLRPYCDEVFVSCNASQSSMIAFPKIEDRFEGIGPMGGILSAFQAAPDAAWLVVACDMPLLNDETLRYLVAHRAPSKTATAFLNATMNFPEPLITIWEPRAYPLLLSALADSRTCPRKVLAAADVEILAAPDKDALQNVNDPGAAALAKAQLSARNN